MNDQPVNPSTEPQSLADLRRAHETLRMLFQLAILCGIVLSASVSVLVYKQIAMMQRQAVTFQAMVDDHNSNWVPKLRFAQTNLETFAEKNQSLAPILQKYFSTNAPVKRSPPPPGAMGRP